MKKTVDKDLHLLYDEYLKFTKMNTHSPISIAGVMLSQSLSLYKTMLPPEDFELILETIGESKNNIVKFIYNKPPTLQ
jgi:hypothetical protein